jgi:hypothetical protein
MDFRFCVFHRISLYPESLNCVLMCYQLTADPEVKSTPSETFSEVQ